MCLRPGRLFVSALSDLVDDDGHQEEDEPDHQHREADAHFRDAQVQASPRSAV